MKYRRREAGKRIELYAGPDLLGRYTYALFWTAAYHPGHPDGERGIRERGQVFHGPLPPGVPVADKRPEGRP